MRRTPKLSNAPVYYALTQAQFNPIEAMAKYVNDIQDSLRRMGYTLFERQEVTHLQLGKVVGQAEPKIEQRTSWLMTKEKRTAGFILTTSSLTFHTTHYETREEFVPELLRGLKVVHDVVNLNHISRLGLRYLNAVLPLAGETLNQYLVEGLHGINFTEDRKHSVNESVFQTECNPLLPKGTLISRVFQAVGPLSYPPDLAPHGLVPMPRFDIREARLHGVIDTDHFVEGHMPRDFDKLKEHLFSLHALIKLAFEATITNHAESTWS